MRCLFCKISSDSTKSVEHIVPESLGNKRHVLPKGAVCDGCNNYFSREVEGPVLSHPSLKNLRAWHREPTKKGRFPALTGVHIGTEIDVTLNVSNSGAYNLGPYGIDPLQERNRERLLNNIAMEEQSGGPAFGFIFQDDMPEREMSRFLAKMALEVVYLRLGAELHDVLIDSDHYDRIRNWARRGDNYDKWPFHKRRIFPNETLMRHPDTGAWVRHGFAYDLLLTSLPETFFVFCKFGNEYAINVGGPSIKGYEQWLEQNDKQSPLIERRGMSFRVGHHDGTIQYFLEEN